MKPLAYSYKVDEDGVVRTGVAQGSTIGRFDLAGIWPESPAVAQAPLATQRDLLHVAASVAAADRLSPRFVGGGTETKHQLRWQRDIALEVALESPDRWDRVAPCATELLEFLTGDRWCLRFVQGRRRAVQSVLVPPQRHDFDEIALFSGGLDSAAGMLARHLRDHSRFIAVSLSGTPVRHAMQRGALQHLRRGGVSLAWLPFEHQFRYDGHSRAPEERPRRSRGFLFLAVGAVAASVSGLQRVSIHESGIGALNIRMTPSQVAFETTRAVHPRTLLLMERLMKEVLDQRISFELPFLFETKREVCRSLGSRLSSLAMFTMSCDEGEGHKPESMQHCGLCTSCLFRRVALHGAPDPTRYRCTPRRTHGGYDLAAFELQAIQIHHWARGFESLIDTDPEVRHAVPYAAARGVSPETVRAALVDTYGRYGREVEDFLASVQPIVLQAPPFPKREVQRALFAGTR